MVHTGRKLNKADTLSLPDRPLHQPGDKVYFKAIVFDDDDARYTIPTGKATIKINRLWSQDEVVYEKTLEFSPDATLAGEYEIPKDMKTGEFSLSVTPQGRDADSRDGITMTGAAIVCHFR